MHSSSGHLHAVVNGEIYDSERLRASCIEQFGYQFQSHSDSEVALALYSGYGAPAFLEHLRGEFALIIYDDRTGQIVAARDRFGVKPLFWTILEGQNGGRRKLLFASEAKAFLPLGWKPEWDFESAVLGRSFLGEYTTFKDIKKVSLA